MNIETGVEKSDSGQGFFPWIKFNETKFFLKKEKTAIF
jgi:hypothetical protein